MTQSSRAHKHPPLRSSRGAPSRKTVLAAALGVSALALGACSSVSDLTKQRVAESETVVQQAQQTNGGSESGAIELGQAQEKLAAAKKALHDGQEKQAERAALQAQLHAELAIVETQSAAARRSADEVLASIETLRTEAERNSPTTR